MPALRCVKCRPCSDLLFSPLELALTRDEPLLCDVQREWWVKNFAPHRKGGSYGPHNVSQLEIAPVGWSIGRPNGVADTQRSANRHRTSESGAINRAAWDSWWDDDHFVVRHRNS